VDLYASFIWPKIMLSAHFEKVLQQRHWCI